MASKPRALAKDLHLTVKKLAWEHLLFRPSHDEIRFQAVNFGGLVCGLVECVHESLLYRGVQRPVAGLHGHAVRHHRRLRKPGYRVQFEVPQSVCIGVLR